MSEIDPKEVARLAAQMTPAQLGMMESIHGNWDGMTIEPTRMDLRTLKALDARDLLARQYVAVLSPLGLAVWEAIKVGGGK